MANIVKVTGGEIQGYDREQIDLIKNTVAVDATDAELGLFLYQAKAIKLDPLLRQIHLVKRKAKRDGRWVDVATIQTGIDGFRCIAERQDDYMPGPEPTYEVDHEGKLISATATAIKIKIGKEWEIKATAFYDEYVQIVNSTGLPNSMWKKMPKTMLAKCAESLALRKGWPDVLSGIHTDEEMQQADNEIEVIEGEVVEGKLLNESKAEGEGSKIAVIVSILGERDFSDTLSDKWVAGLRELLMLADGTYLPDKEGYLDMGTADLPGLLHPDNIEKVDQAHSKLKEMYDEWKEGRAKK